MMTRILLVSADGHATAYRPDLRPFVPSRLLDEFDAWIAAVGEVPGTASDPLFDPAYQWDDELRWKLMEAEGVAAEVIFPNFDTPFKTALHGDALPPELEVEAFRVVNRWMADYVGRAGGRRAGHIQISAAGDPKAAVQEIRWGRANGLSAVLLPGSMPGVPFYYHPRYEPIWDVCEELGMPIVCHVSSNLPWSQWQEGIDDIPDDHPLKETAVRSAAVMIGPECMFHLRRILWQLTYGGIFARHSGLELVITEGYIDWVPTQVRYLDWMHTGTNHPIGAGRRANCPRLPSEYIAEQVYWGASFMSATELAMRHEVGVDHIMFGVDFPHVESTAPNTLAYLQATFGQQDVPDDEARLMLGETAARLYGFDVDLLRPVAERVGFTTDEVLHPGRMPGESELGRNVLSFTRPPGL